MCVLSIIIPTYNRESILLKRLNEISSVEDLRVIIVDDFSKKSLQDSNYAKNIILIRNTKNKGRGGSILTGLNKVNTKFVSIFDDDDPINSKNLNLIIQKLKELDKKSIGIVAEAGLNNQPLEGKFRSYLYKRFKTTWLDRKEFVNTEILKSSIPFWLRGRRIPTSFLFSLCDRKGYFWEYYNIDVIAKNYSVDGMTSQLKKNPLKKSLFISFIFLVYRKLKLLNHEIFKTGN